MLPRINEKPLNFCSPLSFIGLRKCSPTAIHYQQQANDRIRSDQLCMDWHLQTMLNLFFFEKKLVRLICLKHGFSPTENTPCEVFHLESFRFLTVELVKFTYKSLRSSHCFEYLNELFTGSKTGPWNWGNTNSLKRKFKAYYTSEESWKYFNSPTAGASKKFLSRGERKYSNSVVNLDVVLRR